VKPKKEEKTASGNYRVRKRDGQELQRKGFWIPADQAHALTIWCAINKTDESEVVTTLLTEFLRSNKR
jgi:hypothetical protein